MCVGLDPSWYIQHVVVWDLQSEHMFFFLLEDWLSVENDKNSTVEKDVLASCKLLHLTLMQHLISKFGVVGELSSSSRSRRALRVQKGLHLTAGVWGV